MQCIVFKQKMSLEPGQQINCLFIVAVFKAFKIDLKGFYRGRINFKFKI